MALTLIPKQPLSLDPEDRDKCLTYKTNVLGVILNSDFSQGVADWTVLNGLFISKFALTGTSSFLTDGANKFKISQDVNLEPGDYTLTSRYNHGNTAITATVKIGAVHTQALTLTPGIYHVTSSTFTIATAGTYSIVFESTYAILSPVSLGHIVISDGSEVDATAIQIQASGKGVNLLPSDSFNVSTRATAPSINAFDGAPKSWGDLAQLETWTRTTQAVLDAAQKIIVAGRYLLEMAIDDFTLTNSRCDTTLAASKILAQYNTPVSLQTLEACIGPEVPGGPPDLTLDTYADLVINDYVDCDFIGRAENSGSQYDLVVSWEDVRVKAIPCFVSWSNIALKNSRYYRFKFKISGLDKVTVIIRNQVTQVEVYKEESALNRFDRVFTVPVSTDYQVLIEWPEVSEIVGPGGSELSLEELEAPLMDIVEEGTEFAWLFGIPGVKASEPAIVGTSYSIQHLFNVTWLVPPGKYYLRFYDETAPPPTVYIESNTFAADYAVPEDLLKITYTSGGYIKSGASLMNFKDFPTFEPAFRIRALIYNPFNSDARESYEFRTGFIDSSYVKQRTIRILQAVDHLPEFILLALFFALMSDEVIIGEDRYQKISEDDLAPDWPSRVQKAPVNIRIHRVGEHSIKDNAGERLSLDIT